MESAELCTSSPCFFPARWDSAWRGRNVLQFHEPCCPSPCRSIANLRMESVTCAGLCLSEPIIAFLSCAPHGQGLGFGVLQGRAEGHTEPLARVKLGWEPWFTGPYPWWQFPWISDACGSQELFSQLPAGCGKQQLPSLLMVPFLPHFSPHRDIPGSWMAPAAPLVFICCVWWLP